MNCDQARDQINLYVAGELDADERRTLEKHLESCTSCTESVKKASNLHFLVKTAFRSVPSPTSSSKNVMNTIQGRLKQDLKPVAHPLKISFWSFIAAACLIALATTLIILNQPKEIQQLAKVLDGSASISENIISTDKVNGKVSLYDKTIIELEPNTKLKVERPDTRRVVTMDQGSASFDVTKNEKEFEVKTPVGKIRVIGTKFQVSIKEENMKKVMIVLVLAGVVQVANAVDSVTAREDERVVVAQDEKPIKHVEKPIDQDKWPICEQCGSTKHVEEYKHYFSHDNPCPKCEKILGFKKCKCDPKLFLRPQACNECAQKEQICFICGKKLQDDLRWIQLGKSWSGAHEEAEKTNKYLLVLFAYNEDSIKLLQKQAMQNFGTEFLKKFVLGVKIGAGFGGDYKPDLSKGEIFLFDTSKNQLVRESIDLKNDEAFPKLRKDLERFLLEKEIKELLKKLDDEDANERVKATEKLIELGKIAKETVKKAVEEHLKKAKDTKNAEVISRCEQILKQLELQNPDLKFIKSGLHENGCCKLDHQLYTRTDHTCKRCEKVFKAGINAHELCWSCTKELGICGCCHRKWK